MENEMIEEVKLEKEESDVENDEQVKTFLMDSSGSVRISDDRFENVTKIFVQGPSGSTTFSLTVTPIAAVEDLENIAESIKESNRKRKEPKPVQRQNEIDERRAIEEKYEDEHGNLKCDKCSYSTPLKGRDDLTGLYSMAEHRLTRYHLFRKRIVYLIS